ncbi:MAG: hypothetical protein ACP5HG_14005 [Anaerolineae bacterium]
MIGASEERAWQSGLFDSVVDWIGGVVPCSILFCRRYEPVITAWLRRRMKSVDREYHRNGAAIASAEAAHHPVDAITSPGDSANDSAPGGDAATRLATAISEKPVTSEGPPHFT